ncbi:MAG TPA: hypothetical protein VFW22_08745 [Pseudolabrys sp.]|nr:hypothetical protein [Pseudolabrys sp.]
MRLGEIKRVATRPAGFTPREAAPEVAEKPASGHALIPVAPAADGNETPNVYRQAPFLAQLLAMRDQHPQTRERRKATPDVAIAAYRSTAALTQFR